MQIKTSIINQDTIIRFKEPNLLFKTDQTSVMNNALEGIQTYGPYDYNNNKRVFDRIQFIIVGPDDKKHIEKVLKLVGYLKNSLKNFKGFPSMFNLEELIIPTDESEVVFYGHDKNKEIIHKLNDLYPISKRSRNQMDCIISFGEDHRAIKSTKNYYTIKDICLKNGYPIQYLSSFSADRYSGVLEKMSNLNNLQYILWNISVAIYTKVGGIPWILKNSNNVDITLGLRFSRNEDKGYTTGFIAIFNSYGEYMGIFSETFSDEDYGLSNIDNLFKSGGMTVPAVLIKKLIGDSLDNYYKFQAKEIGTLAVQKIGQFGNVEKIGFEEVLESHDIENYSLIEIYNKNLQRFFNLDKNSLNIDRGICFPFSENHGFLCTTGDYKSIQFGREKIKEHIMGTPKPFLVNLRTNYNCYGNFIDACQDIFSLTGLHYQTVTHNEIRLPATLLFAHRIANFSKYGIKPHDLLKNTPWFL
ncbi:MAG: Piwi domain-containing protein [Candidatus Thorarchaeota archaeon]